jgi:hypothetical protein
MNMKYFLILLSAFVSLSAIADVNEYACPAYSFNIYSCKAHPETATSLEVREFSKELLVCYSSQKNQYKVVVKDPENKVDTFTVFKTEGKTNKEFALAAQDAPDQAIAALSIQTQSTVKNAKLTFLLPGIDMKMTCLKTK